MKSLDPLSYNAYNIVSKHDSNSVYDLTIIWYEDVIKQKFWVTFKALK